MFVHYKVGGEGLNLTEANHVICMEPWWNNAVPYQGISRSWRRGQTKDVHVHWVITKGSIEKPILIMCENKSNMADSYLNGTDPIEMKSTGLNKESMLKLLNDCK